MHRSKFFRIFISVFIIAIGFLAVSLVVNTQKASAASTCIVGDQADRAQCRAEVRQRAIETCRTKPGVTEANFLQCVKEEEEKELTATTSPSSGSATSPKGSGGAGGADALTCSEIRDEKLISSNGLINYFCFLTPGNAGRNAVEVIIEQLANLLIFLTVLLFSVMLTLAMIQLGVSGGSPAAVTAAKKRILLSVTSIALLWLARLILTLTGVVGGKFLGIDVKNGNFADPAFLGSIINAIITYLRYTGGALAVIMLIFGGIRMITSAGNPKAIEQAKKIIAFAIISIIVIAGFSLIQAVIQLIITGSYSF